MERILLFLCVVFVVPSVYEAADGLVDLDEFTFDKITGKFEAALVKFDVAYPYGAKHEAFMALSKEVKDVDELLVANVGVKDYGEKENEALANKFGILKDNFPVVKLFLKGQDKPITFDETKDFTTDNLREFVRENSGLYISMPGCVKELDMLADKFIKSNADDRKKIVEETGILEKKSTGKDASAAKIYKTIMEKIIEKGDKFVKTEQERVKKLLGEKLSDEKKKTLQMRLNILHSFQQKGAKNDEL